MNSKSLLIACLAILAVASARPKISPDETGDIKVREKRKYEIPLLRQMEESGVGVKREAKTEEAPPEKAAAVAPEDGGGEEDAKNLRVKKQSPNNIGGCGKTACGPIVSARGPAVEDMRAMLQAAALNEMTGSKPEAFDPVQGRTVDTIVAPVALGSLGYGAPAAYSASPPAINYAHSFFKPPSAPAVPAVAVIAAPHQPSHPLIHPWLLPHLLPHLMPHVMPHLLSNVGSYFVPHRLEPARYPEGVPTEIKQPPLPAAYYGGGADAPLLCQPLRSQRLEFPYDFYYKPDVAGDKSINVTDGSKKSQSDLDGDEERKIREHLRKVAEIRDEISQLNRAAQRIVDQQERLTALQQKQLMGGPGHSPSQAAGPYMGSGYYPAAPWGYSGPGILSYPRSEDDIGFFLDLLRKGKKMGVLSDALQPPVLQTIGEVLKGVQDGGKPQKDAPDGAPHSDDGKSDKKSPK